MGTRFLCLLFKFLVLLYFDTVVDVFPASVSQNDSSVIGLACFRGIELLHIHFAGFKERGGNLRGKSGLAFLEKAVVLPHDKGTFFVAAIIVFLPLMDGGTATGAFADRGLFLPEQILFPVKCCGVCPHKLPRHIGELNGIFKRLYEDSVSGRITDERFMELSTDYEQEQATLKARAAELQAELGQAQEAAVNVEKFMAVVRKYTSFEELTPTLLREFVEKIVVHECWKDEQGTRHQDIEIYYSFVGKVDLPDD